MCRETICKIKYLQVVLRKGKLGIWFETVDSMRVAGIFRTWWFKSPAKHYGVEVGDVIASVNLTDVSNVFELRKALKGKHTVCLGVRRVTTTDAYTHQFL